MNRGGSLHKLPNKYRRSEEDRGQQRKALAPSVWSWGIPSKQRGRRCRKRLGVSVLTHLDVSEATTSPRQGDEGSGGEDMTASPCPSESRDERPAADKLIWTQTLLLLEAPPSLKAPPTSCPRVLIPGQSAVNDIIMMKNLLTMMMMMTAAHPQAGQTGSGPIGRKSGCVVPSGVPASSSLGNVPGG